VQAKLGRQMWVCDPLGCNYRNSWSVRPVTVTASSACGRLSAASCQCARVTLLHRVQALGKGTHRARGQWPVPNGINRNRRACLSSVAGLALLPSPHAAASSVL
jgi:hypothetical protein